MFWADKIASELKKKGPQHVDDMKTPSGKIHVGALRGVLIHDLVYRALKEVGVKVNYTYIIDNHDPMDSLPVYLDQKKYASYMGVPLNKIPAPDGSSKSYAQYFAEEFTAVFKRLGAYPEILWAWDFYTSGQMDKAIKLALDNAQKIQDIYQKVSGSKKKEIGWYPFQPICEKCGKLGTTKATAWDGEKVTYQCLPDLVTWARGCSYQGKVSPFGGTGKLPWKVEWPAVWFILGVTIEGEGKDLASQGGARDTSNEICREIFKIEPPYDIPYEHFLIGGRKMSTSKGWGASAAEMIEILPAEILRFLMVKTRYSQAIDFTPEGMTIPDLFDEYDRCAKEWFEKGRKSDLGRIFELSQVNQLPKGKIAFPRFRDVATFMQMPGVDIKKQFPDVDKQILEERIKYAKIWLDGYAPADFVFKIQEKLPKEAEELSSEQKKYLREVAEIVQKDWKDETQLSYELYEAAKKVGLPSAKAFEAIYLVLLGKSHGPKAAALLLTQEKGFLLKRFKETTEL